MTPHRPPHIQLLPGFRLGCAGCGRSEPLVFFSDVESTRCTTSVRRSQLTRWLARHAGCTPADLYRRVGALCVHTGLGCGGHRTPTGAVYLALTTDKNQPVVAVPWDQPPIAAIHALAVAWSRHAGCWARRAEA